MISLRNKLASRVFNFVDLEFNAIHDPSSHSKALECFVSKNFRNLSVSLFPLALLLSVSMTMTSSVLSDKL